MNVAYSSPLKLFPGLNDVGVVADSSFLNGLKRRMLAEFQLNDEKPLLIDGRYYSKDDIIQLIDKLKEENAFEHHLKIWNNKDLLNFLEKSSIPTSADSWKDLQNDEKFIQFISPYFSETYNIALSDRFKKMDHEALQSLLRLPLLISTEDELKLYANAQRTVHSLVKELRVVIELVNAKSFKEKPATLKKYYSRDLIECLNALPMLFMGMRNQLATELINLYVAAYNGLKRPDLAQEIIEHATRLKVETYERSLLDERMEEIRKLRKTAPEDTPDKSVWVVLKIVGVVVYILIMIARGCGNNSNSSSVENSIPNFNVNSFPIKPLDLLDTINYAQVNSAILSGIGIERIRISHEVNKIYSSSRPKTGAAVMRIPEKTNAEVVDENTVDIPDTGFLMVVNQSDYDCVVMLALGSIRNHYLRKNDSILFSQPEVKSGEVCIYSGKKWYDNACYYTIGIGDTARRCGMFDAYENGEPRRVEKRKLVVGKKLSERIVFSEQSMKTTVRVFTGFTAMKMKLDGKLK